MTRKVWLLDGGSSLLPRSFVCAKELDCLGIDVKGEVGVIFNREDEEIGICYGVFSRPDRVDVFGRDQQ